MKRTIILLLAACLTAISYAQTSRRTIEKFANEAVKQITLTGRTPTVDLLDSLANNAERSIEMLSRMGDPDDVRQQQACIKLIDCIVDYSQTETGRKYTDVVRKGLTKALDRSFEPDVQLHVMEQLARCAKPADAAHIAMYLEMPELQATAYRILLDLPDIDDRIAEAAAAQPGIKAQVQSILDVRAGRRKAPASATAQPRPQPVAVPMWTESLDRVVADMCRTPNHAADSIIIRCAYSDALPELLRLASRHEGLQRDAILARYVMLAERVAMRGELKPDGWYLALTDADALVSDPSLRSKIILGMGQTHSIQALSYLRRYTGKPNLADAMAIATTEIIGARPEANGGRAVSAMQYAAKQSFIRHYDEKGIDNYIDQVLAAIDNWHANAGYDMAHTDDTRMGKRGFWILHDELEDANIVFDWQASGTLTLSVHSTPVLLLNRNQGVKVAGDTGWRKFDNISSWATASVTVKGDAITVSVNGSLLVDGEKAKDLATGLPVAKSGTTKLLADDDGAVVRQFSFCRQ